MDWRITGMSSPTQNSPAPSPREVDPDGRCEQAVLFDSSQEPWEWGVGLGWEMREATSMKSTQGQIRGAPRPCQGVWTSFC